MEKKKKGLNIRTSTNTTANSLSGVFPLFWYNKEKGADTMMNPAMFDPIALDAWYSDENNDSLLQTELENYLQNYFPCFSLRPQRRLFQTFIQGLMSPLERKSIEPVALHFYGEKYELLSRQIGAGCGMLSVDDTSFVKKREAFRRGKTAVLWLPGENGKLPVRGVPCLRRGQRIWACGL